jgi:hypothetical protein
MGLRDIGGPRLGATAIVARERRRIVPADVLDVKVEAKLEAKVEVKLGVKAP